MAHPGPRHHPLRSPGRHPGDRVISSGGYDIGGTAFALSSKSSTIPSMRSAAPATTTPAPAATIPTVKPATGRRPNQEMHHKAHLHDLAINALHNGHRNRYDREG